MTLYSRLACFWAMLRPKPRLPPVTMTLRTLAHQLACHLDTLVLQKRNSAGYFVPRKGFPAEFQNLPLKVGRLTVLHRCPQSHVGNDKSAGNGAVSLPHDGHAYLRVTVDHRLNLFRMNLQSAHIDNAVAP